MSRFNVSYVNSLIRDEYYCIPELFWENVGSDKEEVYALIKKANKREDLEAIICKYI